VSELRLSWRWKHMPILEHDQERNDVKGDEKESKQVAQVSQRDRETPHNLRKCATTNDTSVVWIAELDET